MKPVTVAPVVGLIEANFRLVTPLTVLNVPATNSLVPSGLASMSVTPPSKVGPEVGVHQTGGQVERSQEPLVVVGGVAAGVVPDGGEAAGDVDAVADVLQVVDLTGR